MEKNATSETRGYDLRKRLENMDQTRRTVLEAAREQLEGQGYPHMTMASLAAVSGVTRQTIHNLFGSKRGVLEALFDSMALAGGMERMRDVMHESDGDAMLQSFVHVFCDFWEQHRALLRRVHGIGAIDPDFGILLEARNQRRHGIANRITKRRKKGREATIAAATLTALTSFEYYDTLIGCGQSAAEAEASILELAVTVVGPLTGESR